jgi:hypothetical protein
MGAPHFFDRLTTQLWNWVAMSRNTFLLTGYCCR